MTKEFEFLKAELERMKENHTWQDVKQVESMQGPSVTVNHKKVIQLSSNNYLGFTSHPRLIKAAQEVKPAIWCRYRFSPNNRRNVYHASRVGEKAGDL